MVIFAHKMAAASAGQGDFLIFQYRSVLGKNLTLMAQQNQYFSWSLILFHQLPYSIERGEQCFFNVLSAMSHDQQFGLFLDAAGFPIVTGTAL